MSIDRGMAKEDVVHIENGVLLSHKKEQNNAICSNMDGLRNYYTKWSKSERERQIPYDITYMWNLIYGTNEPFHSLEIMDLENRLAVAKGEWDGLGAWA